MFALRCMAKRWTTEIKGFRKYTMPKEKRKSFMKRHFFLINVTTSGGCMFLGDLVEQAIEYRSKMIDRLDWKRLGRMFIIGMIIGPPHHYYYVWLDKWMPKVNLKIVLFKVISDQIVASPLILLIFYYGMGILEGKPLDDCTEEIKRKFELTYLVDWLYWPPVQFINFYLVPNQYRVVYVNVATMVFNIFLSFMKHFDQKDL